MITRKHVTFSEHANYRMIQRRITVDEVIRVMNEGTLIERPRPPRMRLIAEMALRHGVVRVIWTIVETKLHVVTVMWKE